MREKPETVRFYQMRLPHWEVVRGRYFVTIRLKGSIPDEGLQRIRFLAAQAADAVAIGFDGAEERRRALKEIERWLHSAPRVRHLADPRVAEAVEEAIRHREEQGIWTMFSHVVMPNHIHLFFRLGPKDEPGLADPLHRRLVEPATTRPPPCQAGSRASDERAVDPLHRRLVEPATTRPPPCQTGSRAVDERAVLASQTEQADQTGSRAVDERAVSASDEEGCWRRQKLRLDRVMVSFKRWTATRAARIAGLDPSQFWQREWFDHWSRSPEEDEATEQYIRQNRTRRQTIG